MRLVRMVGLTAGFAAVAASAHAQDVGVGTALEACSEPQVTAALGLIPKGTTARAFPAIGQQASVEVGESMIFQETTSLFDLVNGISGPFSFSGKAGFNTYRVVVGPGELRKSKTVGLEALDYEFFYNKSDKPTKFGRPDIVYFFREPDRLHASVNYGMGVADAEVEGAHLAVNRCIRRGPSDFRQELVYTGVSKGTVTLTYREFKGDFARPAFSQTLTYDLADGNEIGFKGARFRIDAATNLSIKYTVLKQLTASP